MLSLSSVMSFKVLGLGLRKNLVLGEGERRNYDHYVRNDDYVFMKNGMSGGSIVIACFIFSLSMRVLR